MYVAVCLTNVNKYLILTCIWGSLVWKYAVDIPARREVSGPGREIIVFGANGLYTGSGGFWRCIRLKTELDMFWLLAVRFG